MRSIFRTLGWIYLSNVLLLGCSEPLPPQASFDAHELPTPPDYTLADAWASLPDKQDPADELPKGVAPTSKPKTVDVFFIHPTTFFDTSRWNAGVYDSALNANTDEWAIKNQASIFNEQARIYAPRYRQMTYNGFFTKDLATEIRAINVAYEDIKAAFEYYLAHYNQGRPILVASHSQGSIHGIRLLKEYFDGKPLQPQLVAAYLVGWPFPADTFEVIPVCESPEQTGCIMGWSTWRKGKLPKNYEQFYRGAVVVNPLTWQTDEALAPKHLHQGLVGYKFQLQREGKLQAQIHDGVLWVNRPLPFITNPDYHIADYNLFWPNVRENVATRISAYLQEAHLNQNQ